MDSIVNLATGVEGVGSLHGRRFECCGVACLFVFGSGVARKAEGDGLVSFEVGGVISWSYRQAVPLIQYPLAKNLHGAIASRFG
jgi:hypothetical protein